MQCEVKGHAFPPANIMSHNVTPLSLFAESMNGDFAVSALAPNSSTPSCNHEHKISFKVPNIEKFVTRKEKKRKERKRKKNQSHSEILTHFYLAMHQNNYVSVF